MMLYSSSTGFLVDSSRFSQAVPGAVSTEYHELLTADQYLGQHAEWLGKLDMHHMRRAVHKSSPSKPSLLLPNLC